MEKYKLRRWTTYCPCVGQLVNQELSYTGQASGKKDVVTTCTGIEDQCSSCIFLMGSNIYK